MAFSYINWNHYWKSMLASSDYEGVVQLWDATTSQCTVKFHVRIYLMFLVGGKLYSVSSRVWTVPSLSAWKFWKIREQFRPRRAVGFDRAGGSINCPSRSKSSRIFQNFHADRDGTVHTLDGIVFAITYIRIFRNMKSAAGPSTSIRKIQSCLPQAQMMPKVHVVTVYL